MLTQVIDQEGNVGAFATLVHSWNGERVFALVGEQHLKTTPDVEDVVSIASCLGNAEVPQTEPLRLSVRQGSDKSPRPKAMLTAHRYHKSGTWAAYPVWGDSRKLDHDAQLGCLWLGLGHYGLRSMVGEQNGEQKNLTTPSKSDDRSPGDSTRRNRTSPWGPEGRRGL